MPNFTPKPPVYEARMFTGGVDGAMEIQGWMLANNVQSEHIAAVGSEGDENFVSEHILYVGDTSRPEDMSAVLNVGEWLMWNVSQFEPPMTNEYIYNSFTNVP